MHNSVNDAGKNAGNRTGNKAGNREIRLGMMMGIALQIMRGFMLYNVGKPLINIIYKLIAATLK